MAPTRAPAAEPLAPLAALLRGRPLAVLTGAGCSTESGIPDYRGPETARRARNPIQGREFLVRRAAERGIPIGMINLGPARGEELCAARVEAKAGEVLPPLVQLLTGT